MALLTGKLLFSCARVTGLVLSLLTAFGRLNSLLRPDVRCLLLCPVCENMAQPDGDYWMLYYPLLQLIPPVTFGTRTTQRLTCGSCMESLVQGISCKSLAGEHGTMMERLEALPNATFLDGPDNPILSKMTNTDLSAWDLYSLWINSGAWEANEIVCREWLQEVLGNRASLAPNPNLLPGQVKMDADIGRAKNDLKKQADSTCRTCSKEMLPQDVMRCSRCKKAAYCNRECQKKDWPRHKLQCAPSPQN
jgi:MYND finger